MAFFLETLFGGLMAGMLYSLVALGFVLIYKASGVFNFAQGAMVLFAALAMARFGEWIPLYFGITHFVLVNFLAFAGAAATPGTSVSLRRLAAAAASPALAAAETSLFSAAFARSVGGL